MRQILEMPDLEVGDVLIPTAYGYRIEITAIGRTNFLYTKLGSNYDLYGSEDTLVNYKFEKMKREKEK